VCGLLKVDFVCVVGSVGAGGGTMTVQESKSLCVLLWTDILIFLIVAESMVATLKATFTKLCVMLFRRKHPVF